MHTRRALQNVIAKLPARQDYEFSRARMRALWAAGRTDMRLTVANPDWRGACSAAHGTRTFDLPL